MKTKHTPAGPWFIETTADSHFILDADSTQIAQLDAIGPQSFTIANARLIAAAPSLLRSLEIIADEAEREALNIGQSARRGDQSKADTFRFIAKEARMAIAKATGGAE
jgi:hypothetical protein